MSSIDERVVEMKFKNAQFENGIKQTTDSLDKLKAGLKLDGATQGLGEVEKAASRFSLRGIMDAIQNVITKFPVLGAIGFTAIQNLTNSVIGFGKQIAGAVLDPLIEGGKKRALSIEQAKFQFKGLGMDVEQSMADALYAVKGTAFGLDEAAMAAAQFGASGVESGTEMRNALRGISGVAAMAGSSYTDMANVFTKVAGQGRVMGDDLNRLGARGINAAAVLGKAFGKTEAEIREMVSKGQISFEMFAKAMSDAFGEHATKANETYAGSLANVRAALSRIGASFWESNLVMQRDIFNSLGPAIDRVSDALEPLYKYFAKSHKAIAKWATTLIDGLDFKWLELSIVPIVKSINNVFQALFAIIKPIGKAFLQIFPPASAKQIESIAKGIERFTASLKIGGTTANNLQRTFAGLFAVLDIGWTILKYVIVTLADLFGVALDGSGSIFAVTGAMGDFLVKVRDAIKSGDGLKNFFKGLGAVLKIPIQGIKIFVGALALLIEAIRKADFSKFTKGLENLRSRFKPLSSVAEFIVKAWSKVPPIFEKIMQAMAPFIKIVGGAFRDLGSAIAKAMETADFSLILDAINTGLFGALIIMIKNFLKGFQIDFSMGLIDSIKGIFGSLTDTMSAMQQQLKAGTLIKIAVAIALLTASVVALSLIDSAKLTKALTAITIMFGQLFGAMAIFEKITAGKGFLKMPVVAASLILLGIAINILASAVKKLSDLDWDELAKGLLGVMTLLGSMAGVTQVMSTKTPGMISTGIGLIALAAAIKILASAVNDLSGLSWEEMAKGLVGVGGLLASLAIFTKLAAANKGGLIQSAGLVILAAAIKILASAVTDFAGLNWQELGKGMAAIGGVLLAVTIFTKMNKGSIGLIASATGLVILAAAMKVLGGALKGFAGMSWQEISKSLITLAGALIIMAGAMFIMQNALPGAAALIVASAALMILAPALLSFKDLSWESIAKIMVTLAGALLIIAGGMAIMVEALPGAAALIVVAAALRILQPVLLSFAKLTWTEIAKGLTMLAGAFLVIGVAGAVLTPVIPTLLGLGAAILLLGVGTAAAGIGVMAFAAGLTALAAAGAAGTAAMVVFVSAMAGLLPHVARQIGLAVVEFAKTIAAAAPAVSNAMVAVINALMDAIIRTTPKVKQALTVLLNALIDIIIKISPRIINTLVNLTLKLLRALENAVPKMVVSGMNMINGILRGIAKNIGKVVTSAVSIVTNFLNGISRNLNRIIQAGFNLIINFINGLANAIRRNSAAVSNAGWNLALAIIEGMVKGLSANLGYVASWARYVAWRALDAAKRLLGINSPSKAFIEVGKSTNEGFALGIQRYAGMVTDSAEDVSQSAIDTVKDSLKNLSDEVGGDIDLNPVIVPVLDLSDVKKNANEISKLLPKEKLTVDMSYQNAKDIRSDIPETGIVASSAGDGNKTINMEYTQNNNSPKALSPADIYRQTRNQLSTLEGALTV